MRTKKLEQFFKEYAASHSPPQEDDIEMAPLFSTEQFHVNVKQGTVFIEGLGVAQVPDLANSPKDPEWLAIVKMENGLGVRLVMGHGNPYQEGVDNLLPQHNGFITVVPQSLLAPYQELQEKVKNQAAS